VPADRSVSVPRRPAARRQYLLALLAKKAYTWSMETVKATELKNRLGAVLARATVGRVAIERHGRVVAYLVPVPTRPKRAPLKRNARPESIWSRRDEERVLELCAKGDFRPSRWLRAGNPRQLAGVAVMLASQNNFDRPRMLALAERLYPGTSTPAGFSRWLSSSPIHAARFLPMLHARMQERAPRLVARG
jgi:antitoxin (DNA-binding transcriptional repressor) of toxin-antitoxin stability system